MISSTGSGLATWSDAWILNVSTHGLLIETGRKALSSDIVELSRGEQVIRGRVMWREGTRAGIRVEGRLPVEDIMTLDHASVLELTAGQGETGDRRARRRSHDDNRLRARSFEFASIGVVAICLAGTVFTMVEQALATPLALVKVALGS